MSSAPIDIGDGHLLYATCWAPDRELNPHLADVPDIPLLGYRIEHPRPDGTGTCQGHVNLDLPGVRDRVGGQPVWQVVSLDPLTITPSVLCRACGDHGFITDGRWVAA